MYVRGKQQNYSKTYLKLKKKTIIRINFHTNSRKINAKIS